jgi:transcriptional regulator EpsA
MSSETMTMPGGLVASHTEAIVHVIETAVEVRRRYQFFIWTQSSFQLLLPHKVAICGVYERTRKQVHLEAFNSISVPASVLGLLTDGQSPLMRQVVGAWINNRGRPLIVRLAALPGQTDSAACNELLAAGFGELLVHGVSRPQRASEIETLFVFASPGECISERQRSCIDLLLPHLHSTYLRVQSYERESSDTRSAPTVHGAYTRTTITDREEEILRWVREGMSNHQIGIELGISPLTVKNHVQKILRKLGAANRAQAVARAMSMNLLGRSPSDGSGAD